MMHDDFDDLDRMLAALPLEEAPAGLHARILTATIYRPRAAVQTWELWLLGTLLALAAWVTWLVATAPHAGERFVSLTTQLIDAGGLNSFSTALWLAVGVSAAWWISEMSFPVSVRRIRIR